MTPFTDKEKPTIGDLYHPAMEITDQEDADQYFEKLVQLHMKSWGKSREEAERTERSNLGYFSGYYDEETARRVATLFQAKHPVFGDMRDFYPTPLEAYNAGRAAGGAS